MPELSIIVPIFNGEEYLRRCIESILSQTFTDFELILIDDGSTDNSRSICNEYALKDSRIVVYHKENAGLVAARKSGLSLAKGEYIGFVDCDDYIDDNMYFDLMKSAKKDKSDVVASGIIIDFGTESNVVLNSFADGFYDEDSIKNIIMPKMLIYSGFVKYGIIPGVVTKVFRRCVLEKALPNVFDEITIGEDVAITAYCMMDIKSLSIIETAGYHYVQLENSMVRVFNPKKYEKISALYSCVSKIKNESYQKQVYLYMCYLIFNVVADCVKKSGYTKKEAKKAVKNILKDDVSAEVLKNADISKLSFKNRVKIFLMKYKLINLLMLLI